MGIYHDWPYTNLHGINLNYWIKRVEEAFKLAGIAEEKAEEALAKVLEALEKAELAQISANNAQTSADNAQISADNAQASADNAQISANTAQSDVNSLKPRVSTLESRMTQAEINITILREMIENLDIEQEVKDIINQLVEDGYFNELIDEFMKNDIGFYPSEEFRLNTEELNTWKNKFADNSFKYANVISLYDSINIGHSAVAGQMEKVNAGTDDFGNTFYYYIIRPYAEGAEFSGSTTDYYVSVGSKQSIVISAGIHGDETDAVVSLYLFIKKLCENYNNYRAFFNRRVYIVPVVNPSGFNNRTRVNGNGVDINRNFPQDWRLSGQGTIEYSGASPASEKETKFLINVLNTARSYGLSMPGSTQYFDCHNFAHYITSGNRKGGAVWCGNPYTGMANNGSQIYQAFKNECVFITKTYPRWVSDSGDLRPTYNFTPAYGGYGNSTTYAFYMGICPAFIDTPSKFNNNEYMNEETLDICYHQIANFLFAVAGTIWQKSGKYEIIDIRQLGMTEYKAGNWNSSYTDREVTTWNHIFNRMPRYSHAHFTIEADSPLIDRNLYFGGDVWRVAVDIQRDFGHSGFIITLTGLNYMVSESDAFLGSTWIYKGQALTGLIEEELPIQWELVSPLLPSRTRTSTPVLAPNSMDLWERVENLTCYSIVYTQAQAQQYGLPEGGSAGGMLYCVSPRAETNRRTIYTWYSGTNHSYQKIMLSLSDYDILSWRRLDNSQNSEEVVKQSTTITNAGGIKRNVSSTVYQTKDTGNTGFGVIVNPDGVVAVEGLENGTTINRTYLQPRLVSGTNIKTINGQSVLGTGDITVNGQTNVVVGQEQKIGTWSNNGSVFDLFRKVIDFGALPNTSQKNVAHGISGIEYYTSISGTAQSRSNNNNLPIPLATGTTANNIYIAVGKNNITITTGTDRSSYDVCYITLEYIKERTP